MSYGIRAVFPTVAAGGVPPHIIAFGEAQAATDPLLDIRNGPADGDRIVRIRGDGAIRVNDGLARPFGGSAKFSDQRSTHADTATFVANLIDVHASAAVPAGSAQAWEANLFVEHAAGTTAIGFGVIGHTVLNGAGTLTEGRGGSFGAGNNGDGVLGTAVSVHAEPAFNTGAGSVTNAIGVNIAKQTAGASSNRGLVVVEALRTDYHVTNDELRLEVWDNAGSIYRRVKGATSPPGGARILYIDS